MKHFSYKNEHGANLYKLLYNKSKHTRILNFKKKVGITIKSKETSS